MHRVVLQKVITTRAQNHFSNLIAAFRIKEKFAVHHLHSRFLSSAVGPVSHKAHSAPYPSRTHVCGSLRSTDAGRRVVLTGWIMPERKVSKSLSFYTLKDSSGSTQLVVTGKPSQGNDILEYMRQIPSESTVCIEGEVKPRPSSSQRYETTGEVEVQINHAIVLNPANRQLPFNPSDARNLANEDLRLQFRHLDLRRDELSRNLHKRSKVAHLTRNFLRDNDFIEVETPLLLKSTPEGAREFLVPSRSGGRTPAFYALPQSPQQLKQLLICSGGVDKYYQLARCFRDEDGRKDRQPEFTQIDLEMAYISWGPAEQNDDRWRIGGREIRLTVENLVKRIWSDIEGIDLQDAFAVTTYKEAMSRFGSDKPDTRFSLEIFDMASLLPENFGISLGAQQQSLDCIIVKGSDAAFRAAAERLLPQDKNVEKITLNSSNVTTWFKESKSLGSEQGPIANSLDLEPGDVIWLGKRKQILEASGGTTPLGLVRLSLAELAQELRHYTPSPTPHFLWVTEFPLFTHADDDKEFLARGRWSSSHHPFTAPMSQDLDAFWNGQFAEVRGQHYDLVLNGIEIGGGSVRIHDAEMQDYVLSQVLQLDDNERISFDHLLHALRCGAPPHGGIALGFDRLMAVLCGSRSIRDVIAFPKTLGGVDPLLKSPSVVDNQVLRQYALQPLQDRD